MVCSDFAGKTLLVVDDEDDLRELLGEHFQDSGANVLEANSGRVAINILRKAKVDFIICDVRMSGGDGLSVLHYAKEIQPAPPLLFITGYSDFSLEFAKLSGALDILHKPFKIQELESLVLKNLA